MEIVARFHIKMFQSLELVTNNIYTALIPYMDSDGGVMRLNRIITAAPGRVARKQLGVSVSTLAFVLHMWFWPLVLPSASADCLD